MEGIGRKWRSVQVDRTVVRFGSGMKGKDWREGSVGGVYTSSNGIGNRAAHRKSSVAIKRQPRASREPPRDFGSSARTGERGRKQ